MTGSVKRLHGGDASSTIVARRAPAVEQLHQDTAVDGVVIDRQHSDAVEYFPISSREESNSALTGADS
ncbi:MAG: hypothetical protein R3C42_08675 [Parvularculaceae bacterium]